MTLGHDLGDDRWVALDLLAHEEEGGLRAPLPERLQHRRRPLGMRAVVKRERHSLGAIERARSSEQAGHGRPVDRRAGAEPQSCAGEGGSGYGSGEAGPRRRAGEGRLHPAAGTPRPGGRCGQGFGSGTHTFGDRLVPMPAGATSSRPLATVLDFQRRTVELVADELVEIEGGWVARTPSLPDVWSVNCVRVNTPIDHRLAISVCRRNGLERFDQLYVDDEPSGARLAQATRAEGWDVDVEVHSVLAGEADVRVSTEIVVESGPQETLALMERWIEEDETLNLTPDQVRQVLESTHLTWEARRARRLGVRGEDGELVAMTNLFSDGRVAQIEDVYTAPEARRRGFARALVTRARDLATDAGHELTFIVADDNDWPKELYASLGFQAVGRTWVFHRGHGASWSATDSPV